MTQHLNLIRLDSRFQTRAARHITGSGLRDGRSSLQTRAAKLITGSGLRDGSSSLQTRAAKLITGSGLWKAKCI